MDIILELTREDLNIYGEDKDFDNLREEILKK